MGESLRDGMKERYISLQHTSIQITQTDMLEMIGIQRRSEERQHGNLFFTSQEKESAKSKFLYCELKKLKK